MTTAAADNDIRLKEPKDKMSRALGAAFLGHQVAQLESRANTAQRASPRGRGTSPSQHRSGRRIWNPNTNPSLSPKSTADAPLPQSSNIRTHGPGRRGGRNTPSQRISRNSSPSPPHNGTTARVVEATQTGGNTPVRKRSFSLHPDPDAAPGELAPSPIIVPHQRVKEKPVMASVIVLDASVLVYALGQVRRWCRDERKEIIVVPLEVLNTLDLLKKGSSPVAIHARAASRFLEDQVGSNERIRVQRDDEFIPWDEFYASASASAAAAQTAIELPATEAVNRSTLPSEDLAPEWTRQIVCCAAWEVAHPDPEAVDSLAASAHSQQRTPQIAKKMFGGVALAVVKPLADDLLPPAASPNPASDNLSDARNDAAFLRHTIRANGELVRLWAPLMGLKVITVEQGAIDHHAHGSPHHRGNKDGRGTGHKKGRSSDERDGLNVSGKLGHEPGHRGGGRGGGRGARFGSGGGRDRDGRMVERVNNGVEFAGKRVFVATPPEAGVSSSPLSAPASANSLAGGGGKIRLLVRGEKLDP